MKIQMCAGRSGERTGSKNGQREIMQKFRVKNVVESFESIVMLTFYHMYFFLCILDGDLKSTQQHNQRKK